jgi:DNA polymerase-3 subunit epsilon
MDGGNVRAMTLDDIRFVALDTETTGLDPHRDRIITVGAVAVAAGDIVLADSFEALLPIEFNGAAVTIHGITRDEAREGVDERDAIADLLAYLGDGVIVGHHIGHDIQMIEQAAQRHFGSSVANRSLDTMDLALHLEAAGVLPARDNANDFTLDGLCELFHITPHDRHTAGGDAFLTAQVFQRLYRLAKRSGRTTLEELCAPFVPTR